MVNGNKKLLNQIELLRSKMIDTVKDKGYIDIESLQISQQLDQLLNAYYNINNNQTKSNK